MTVWLFRVDISINHCTVSTPFLVEAVPAHLLFDWGHNSNLSLFQKTPLPCYNHTLYKKPESSRQSPALTQTLHFTDSNTLLSPCHCSSSVSTTAGNGQLFLSSCLLTPTYFSIKLPTWIFPVLPNLCPVLLTVGRKRTECYSSQRQSTGYIFQLQQRETPVCDESEQFIT